MSERKDQETPQSKDGKDILALICAKHAFLLRHHLAAGLWRYLSLNSENWRDRLRPFAPDSIEGEVEKMAVEDVNTLRRFWLGIGDFQEVLSKTKQVKRGWRALELENADSFLRNIADRAIKTIGDKKLQDIAGPLLRHSALYKNISDFWDSCERYYDLASSKNNGVTALKPLEEEMLHRWEELFAVLVIPVTAEKDGTQKLRILSPCLKYHGLHLLHANTDEQAYEAFHRYISSELSEVDAKDYREVFFGGIRSLNCAYFNRLKKLRSSGDHPAALLFGCRSGVQFQLLSDDKDSGSRIIGMVAVYFPLYDFFRKFGLGDDDAGPLVGPAAASGLLSSEELNKGYARVDREYAALWQRRSAMEEGVSAMLRLILVPLSDGANPDAKRMLRHLELMSSRWVDVMQASRAEARKAATRVILKSISTGLFDPAKVDPLCDWLDSAGVAMAEGASSLEDGTQPVDPGTKDAMSGLILAAEKSWKVKCSGVLDKHSSFFDGLGAQENARVFLHERCLDLLRGVALEMDPEESKSFRSVWCHGEIDKVSVGGKEAAVFRFSFQVLFWQGIACFFAGGGLHSVVVLEREQPRPQYASIVDLFSPAAEEQSALQLHEKLKACALQRWQAK